MDVSTKYLWDTGIARGIFYNQDFEVMGNNKYSKGWTGDGKPFVIIAGKPYLRSCLYNGHVCFIVSVLPNSFVEILINNTHPVKSVSSHYLTLTPVI